MIETHDQHKPANLANSAVLKMLEEEESERVYPGYKKVAWPPVSDNLRIRTPTPQPQGGHFYQPQQQTHPNYYSQQQGQSQSQNHQQQNNHQYHQPQPQQQQSYHQQQPQQESSPYQNQSSPHQLYQQQYQRSNSNPPPSHQPSSTASFCGGIPVRESRSPAPPGYQRQKTPVPQQQQYQQPQQQPQQQQQYQQPQQQPQQQQQYHRQKSQEESYSYQNQQNQQYQNQQQQNQPSSPHQIYQRQYHRADSNPHPSHQPSSTVSFSGGISVKDNQSPVPPGYQRQNTPIAQQSYQSQQYQQYQQMQQYQQQQQQQQPFSPSSQGPQSPLNPSAKGWSHVRGPTPTRTSYSQVPSTPQYYQSDNIPHGSSSYDTQFGAGQQNQYYNQPPQSNQEQQQQSYNSPVVSHYQQPSGQQYQYNQQPLSQSQPQQQYNQLPQQYNQPQPQYYHPQGQQQHPQHQQQQQQQFDRGQSPGIITLRKEAPISQKPAPVFHSQPAAERFRGGTNMRGDLKWPPPEVKAQMVAENEERIRIAKSPAFRPRKVQKDYSQFFAKHALNNMYPGYKVPPGTQHVYV